VDSGVEKKRARRKRADSFESLEDFEVVVDKPVEYYKGTNLQFLLAIKVSLFHFLGADLLRQERKMMADMRERWTKHKTWCIQARKDLLEGKKELIKNSGVYIKKRALKRALETQ